MIGLKGAMVLRTPVEEGAYLPWVPVDGQMPRISAKTRPCDSSMRSMVMIGGLHVFS